MTRPSVVTPAPCLVTLDDGRQLGWYEFGEPAGNPVFYFHGFPGSGAEAGWGHGMASSAGVRLIGLDRPGFGHSSFDPGRTILGWADDVRGVADALAIPRFAVLGMSGGGPYALACAARLPERVVGAMVVSGLGPQPEGHTEPGMTLFNRTGLWLAGRDWTSWTLHAVQPMVAYILRRHADQVVAHLARICGPRDREALATYGIGPILEESFRRAVRSGARGMVAEATLFAGFRGEWLDRVSTPVSWYHGARDVIVPLSMAHRAEAAIPRCRVRCYPTEGHFSVLAHHLDTVFSENAWWEG